MIILRTLFLLLTLSGLSTAPLRAQLTLEPYQIDIPQLSLSDSLHPGLYQLDQYSLSNYRFRSNAMVDDHPYGVPGIIRFTDLVPRISKVTAPEKDGEVRNTDPAGAFEALHYRSFATTLIKAGLEEQAEIEALPPHAWVTRERYDQLKVEYQSLKSRMEALETFVNELLAQEKSQEATTALELTPTLQQNSPNPFRRETNIEYFVPPGYQTASIHISTVEGKVVRQIELAQSGRSILHLKTGTFPSGTYQYSLIIDGKLIDTKRMVIVK